MGFEDSTAKCAGWYSKLLSLVHLSAELSTVFGVFLAVDLGGDVGW
jgi:hypothetical protein